MTDTDTPARVAQQLMPLGTTIDAFSAIREEKRKLEASLKTVEEKYRAAEEALMERMEKEGCDKASGKTATISITSSQSTNVIDWDDLWKYIFKMKYTHLLQRRVSDPAIREILESGKKVPGTEQFTKKRLNLRAL